MLLNRTNHLNASLKKVTPVARPVPAKPEAQRQSPRVLQTASAPAQLSLFLRPASAR